MGAAVALRACHDGSRWFERTVLSAPMIALPAGPPHARGWAARALHANDRTWRCVCADRDSAVTGTESFIGNVLTSDPVRYARNAAVLEQEPALGFGAPTVAWADVALRQMKQFAEPAYSASIRQPILMVAAGRDEVVSTPAIEDVRPESACRPPPYPCRRKHEILQEQDHYRGQFWAAFDAFVPGTPRY